MKFSVTTSDPADPEDLRALLLEVTEELSGPGATVLETRMNCEGNPILMKDAGLHPVVVSFDLENGEQALIRGLQAVELLTTALPWLNQVYADLQEEHRSVKLVVVSRKPVPGSAAILATCPALQLYLFRLLHIDDEPRLWLECLSADSAIGESAATDSAATRSANDEDGLPVLSEEEANYFRQL
jgi:hypothetical protein